MEFRMITDLSTTIPQEIQFNFEELKAELSDRLDHYNSLVVTEDTIKDAKGDRSNLNKLREAIETRRKEVKKACMEPYTDFEKRVKELVALIDKPIQAIDKQLSTFEEKRREEKLQQIKESYSALVSDTIKDIIPLERILDPKWLNATTSMKKIEEEIILRAKRVNADMLALDTVPEEYTAAVRAKYIDTLDIEAALRHQEELQRAAEAFKEREKAKQEKDAQRTAEGQGAPSVEAHPGEQKQERQEEHVYRLCLEMFLTKQQANELKLFFKHRNIPFKRITNYES